MGAISDDHVEWAIVNRLKAMLDAPKNTKFNVTQSFALFSAILLWSKQRVWVNENQLRDDADLAANAVRRRLREDLILDPPWSLLQAEPLFQNANRKHVRPRPINGDFAGVTAEDFFKWCRDAIAHGDGRTIRPIHKPSRQEPGKALLAGFQIVFRRTRQDPDYWTLHLYQPDMVRIGGQLADAFCRQMSRDHEYFQQDMATYVADEEAA
ncbi:MAG: hypothetical protein WBX25_33530 [Rhodomicrobium sp.]